MLETAADRARQDAIAQRCAHAWRCTWAPYGPYAPADAYFARDGRVVAIAEIRTLARPFAAYPHVLVDLHKWFTLVESDVFVDLPGLYIVEFRDGLYYTRPGLLVPVDSVVRVTGRTDRPARGSHDQRPTLPIALAHFQPVAVGPRAVQVATS